VRERGRGGEGRGGEARGGEGSLVISWYPDQKHKGVHHLGLSPGINHIYIAWFTNVIRPHPQIHRHLDFHFSKVSRTSLAKLTNDTG
jgi:hypothetical protein